jgi:hypothetical protein
LSKLEEYVRNLQRKENKNRTIKVNSKMVGTREMGDKREWETIDEPELDQSKRKGEKGWKTEPAILERL